MISAPNQCRATVNAVHFRKKRTSGINILVEWRDPSAAGKKHFSRALLPRCGMRARPAGGKEGNCLVRYPALSRSVPRRTRDDASRAGLNNFARPKKRDGLLPACCVRFAFSLSELN